MQWTQSVTALFPASKYLIHKTDLPLSTWRILDLPSVLQCWWAPDLIPSKVANLLAAAKLSDSASARTPAKWKRYASDTIFQKINQERTGKDTISSSGRGPCIAAYLQHQISNVKKLKMYTKTWYYGDLYRNSERNHIMAKSIDWNAYMMSASSTDPVRVPNIPTVQFNGKTLHEHSSKLSSDYRIRTRIPDETYVTWLTPPVTECEFWRYHHEYINSSAVQKHVDDALHLRNSDIFSKLKA